MTSKKPQQPKGESKTPINRERTQPTKKTATSFIISSGGKKRELLVQDQKANKNK